MKRLHNPPHWSQPFNYNQDDHSPIKLALELYSLLIQLTVFNKNYRVGKYIEVNNSFVFVHLHDFFNPDSKTLKVLHDQMENLFFEKVKSPQVQAEEVTNYCTPVVFEIGLKRSFFNSSKSIFRETLSLVFNPSSIISISGESFNFSKIVTQTFSVSITYGSISRIE